jgi:hypothetical protein
MDLRLVDFLIITIYFPFATGFQFILSKQTRLTNDFLSRVCSIPRWIPAYISVSDDYSANAQETINRKRKLLRTSEQLL